MKDLVIFGRSPFISQVDVPRLLERYTTLGFNKFGELYPVDYLFFFDDYYPLHKAHQVFIPSYFAPGLNGERYTAIQQDTPIMNGDFPDKHPSRLFLAHKHYTVSLALNWALLAGFERIYLVGIDHVETDKQFIHHDGYDLPAELTPESHRALKQYVYECAKHAEIYQTNPAVAADWDLPYKDIKELYG